MSYQPNIPTGLLDLSVDYLNIKNNFTALNNVFGVDHTFFDNATSNKGYHTVIHAISQSGDPTQISGTGELYVKTVNSGGNNDTALFFRTGTNGFVSQITNNFVPSNAATGYTYLPGGLIIQWGVVNVPKGISGPYNFPKSFNTFYSISLAMNRGSSLSSTDYDIFLNGTPTTTQFNLNSGTSGSHNVYYIAIGK